LVADGSRDNAAMANTIVMQQVPFDPLAGPVAKKPAKATPRKLAKTPPPAPAKAAKSTIPALRLANDRP
jgi:hypothetical protein